VRWKIAIRVNMLTREKSEELVHMYREKKHEMPNLNRSFSGEFKIFANLFVCILPVYIQLSMAQIFK